MRLLMVFLLMTAITNAQSAFDNREIVIRGHYGYIWAHREKIENIVTGHTSGFEISFQKQTDGSKWWQVVHHYPQTGFSFIHLNLANEDLLGDANAVVGYIKLPFVRKNRFQFALQISAGLGYLQKRWQRTEDYQNLAIGSHINATIQFIGETRFRISDRIFLNLNYGVTHFSNGAFHVPNLGVNNFSLNGGLTYNLGEPAKYLNPEIPELDRSWQLDVLYGLGVKEEFPPAGPQFFAHTISTSFLKPFTHVSNLSLGLDFFYDLSLQHVITEPISKSELRKKMFRSGIHAGYEMAINRFTVLFHMGVYTIDNSKKDGSVYHRTGLKYRISDHLFANLTLKTHYFRADFVELGLGWKFRLGKTTTE
jgi:hypothetical protein